MKRRLKNYFITTLSIVIVMTVTTTMVVWADESTTEVKTIETHETTLPDISTGNTDEENTEINETDEENIEIDITEEENAESIVTNEESDELIYKDAMKVDLQFSSEKNMAVGYSISPKMQAFIGDARWKNGTTWGTDHGTYLGYSASSCCAYAADFSQYVYGKVFSSVGDYHNINEIRAGDAVYMGNHHWFVVLDRVGNSLYTAEGNYNTGSTRIVYISETRYTIENGQIKHPVYGGYEYEAFTCGKHFGAPVNVTKPVVTSVKISDVNQTAGTFTVEALVTSDYGINRVQFPTWTSKNGQDDILKDWGINSAASGQVTSLGGNKYKAVFTVKISDHNNEKGNYEIHVYAYNRYDMESAANGTGIDLSNISAPSITSAKIISANIAGGTYTVETLITSDHGLSKVMFPTWTTKNGQDDLPKDWETNSSVAGVVTSLGGNKYKAVYTVNILAHNSERGGYQTHVYAYNNYNMSTGYGMNDEFDFSKVTVPTIVDAKIISHDYKSGSYTVEVQITSDYGLNRVQFPTWTIKNGQDDLLKDWDVNDKVTGSVTSLGGNKYKAVFTVIKSDHNNEEGIYQTDVYAYNRYNMNSKCKSLAETNLYTVNAKVESSSLSIVDGSIGLNLYLNGICDDFASAGKVSLNGKNYALSGKQQDGSYKFTYMVAAKDMDKNVEIALYDSNNNLLPFSNSNISSGKFIYSVAKYVDTVKTKDDKLGKLALALENYGLCAQNYFSRKSNAINVRNADFSSYEKSITGNMPNGVNYVGSSLILGSKLNIRHYFMGKDKINSCTFSLNGNKLAPVEKGDLYYVEISNVSYRDVDKVFSLKISNGEQECLLRYSALSYAYSVSNDKGGSDDDLYKLVNSLYWYNKAIETYFN